MLKVLLWMEVGSFNKINKIMNKYSKPVLDIEEQIKLLKSRNLKLDNDDKAKKYLNHIWYYRLSQYFKANQYYKIKNKQVIYKNIFKDGTTFKDIIDLYKFDRELRILIMDMVERIEVSIKSNIINELSLINKDAFCYQDNKLFKSDKWYEKIDYMIKDSLSKNKYKKHEIWLHYKNNYSNEVFPPIWMLINTSDFWFVTNLYNNLKYDIREQISYKYGLTESEFWQTIDIIRKIRNIVSHHERLFNLSFSYWINSSIKFNKFIKNINSFKKNIVPTSWWNEKVKLLYKKYKYLEPVKSNFYN